MRGVRRAGGVSRRGVPEQMSLNIPYFECKPREEGHLMRVRHNCNGAINFVAEDEIDDRTANLILMAIEEGKRRRSREIQDLLAGA